MARFDVDDTSLVRWAQSMRVQIARENSESQTSRWHVVHHNTEFVSDEIRNSKACIFSQTIT